jgi:hypothetical protein
MLPESSKLLLDIQQALKTSNRSPLATGLGFDGLPSFFAVVVCSLWAS